MVRVLSFIRNQQTVFWSCCTHFAFSQAMNESSCGSASSLAFGGVSVLDFGLSNRCMVVSCCFNWHFPDDTCCGASFCVLICHLYIFSGEVSTKIWSFLKIRLFSYCWVLRVLCIFWITVLSQIYLFFFLILLFYLWKNYKQNS